MTTVAATRPLPTTRRVLAAALVACTASPAAAQTDRTAVPDAAGGVVVPRFEIAPSPIELEADARSGEYLGVTGPRSAWLGTETGPAELWVHPLKVAREFQLHFQVPAYREPVPGVNVARRITVRPEATTITYTHQDFTVRQHVIAPRDEAGLLVLLDVETSVPLDVVVQFQPVLQYMWPGSFGGQYVFWDEEHNAFVLSESTQRRNAVIGTSWPSEGEAHPAHRLSEAPATFVIHVDSARAAAELIPIGIAAGTAGREEIFATWRGLMEDAEGIYERARTWADETLANTTSLDTPDDSLDLALEWSKVNLEEQRVCNPDLGCGFVAGWGISGTSTRPGFGWYFGGDAAITSLAMDATAQWAPVAEDLRFLARYQRDDGKIPHEISQAAAHIPWFEEYPYPYYHADTTPYWMVALWKYWKASGDEATLAELWGDFREAYAWCLTAETDGDGIIENSAGGYGAIEVGGLGQDLHQDIYLAAVWIAALEATEELARHLGDPDLADEAASLRATALATLNEEYWLPDADQHAFGLMTGRRTNANLTAWPGTAASFRVLDAERAERTLRKLATDSISSDWGARLLSVGSELYEPTHYNNGAVWPFMTGFVAWGQYRYRRPWAGWHLVDAVKHHAFDWARGRFPENFSGAFYQPMDATVPHQFFATSMLAMPLLRGVLGWEPDAPAGRATLAPQLPPSWSYARARNLRVGETTLAVDLVREPNRAVTTARAEGPPVVLDLVQSVPPGARDVAVELPGEDGAQLPAVTIETDRHDIVARVAVRVDSTARSVVVAWTGGLTVEHPSVDLRPGQTSGGLRVVDFVFEDGAWELTLEGDAARAYTLDLRGVPVAPERVEGVEAVSVTGSTSEDGGVGVQRLTVVFPGERGRRAGVVRLAPRPPAG